MECKKCGKTIPKDSKFCVHCGEKVGKEEEKEQLSAEVPKVINDIRNHLEFMGYEIGENQIEEGGVIRLLATNTNRSNLFITHLSSSNVFLFTATYNMGNALAETKRHKLLDAINQINNNTFITTFTVGNEFKTITASSWYPSDAYSKKQFSNFLDFYENEILRMLRMDILQEFV